MQNNITTGKANGESYTKEDLDNGVNSGDLIYVKSYTRSDG